MTLFKFHNLSEFFQSENWDSFAFFLIGTSLSEALHSEMPRKNTLMMFTISSEFLIIYRRYLCSLSDESLPKFTSDKDISINGTTMSRFEKLKAFEYNPQTVIGRKLSKLGCTTIKINPQEIISQKPKTLFIRKREKNCKNIKKITSAITSERKQNNKNIEKIANQIY